LNIQYGVDVFSSKRLQGCFTVEIMVMVTGEIHNHT